MGTSTMSSTYITTLLLLCLLSGHNSAQDSADAATATDADSSVADESAVSATADSAADSASTPEEASTTPESGHEITLNIPVPSTNPLSAFLSSVPFKIPFPIPSFLISFIMELIKVFDLGSFITVEPLARNLLSSPLTLLTGLLGVLSTALVAAVVLGVLAVLEPLALTFATASTLINGLEDILITFLQDAI